MTTAVQKIVNEVRQLRRAELDELLAWLADYQVSEMDAWEQEIAADSRPGGRLEGVPFAVQLRYQVDCSRLSPDRQERWQT